MATSTTMLYGTDSVIEVEIGTLTVDISGSSNKATINLEIIIGEADVFGDKWPQRVMTAKNCTVDCAAWYSSASNEAADFLLDWFNEAAPATRHVDIYINGKTVGNRVLSGDWVFNGVNIDLEPAATNPIPVTFQLLNAGAITILPYAT